MFKPMPFHLHTPIARAAVWMAGWLTLMVVIAVAGREAAQELSVFQIMLLRSTLGMLMLWPLVRAAGGFSAVRTQRLPQHMLRNVVHYAAQYGWFVALTLIPLAQVVSIEFTMPIWSAALAVVFLGERMSGRKWFAVLLGLVGVAVIVRPGAGEIDMGQLIALASAFGFAISVVLVKSLTRTDAAVAISFWMLVVQSAIGLVPGLMVWQWPSAQAWGWVVVVAFCGTYSHYCFARAMQHADATVVVPMDFLRVPLTALVGWLAYSEGLDLFTLLGVGLILSGNVLNLVRWPMGGGRIRRKT
ncbi:MAG: DMT family transporter [Hydrogenophaga sp.]|jgi:drug/metabolite transporter (DMT)-like permease|uniref:DMT family transporter n=1 Tax=Hydrogenophaga sp. TaxID=1904254 RepID=UPI0027292BE3|nr:DMT family transporter [Hydrogenophaga sp.]MDO9483262.1 DMT family transporter [Hydrogenophaga sp.]MDO9568668.1 DMT family transporter [Hydrogenophaga sp.]MDP2218811.1 DMT family transporter [Hydrogenophaga sp.]MDP3343211.1 DMT family transporter [Hydrogenophaga sp.]MDP3808393.1 DMT family transporter [Hydrogenophaga sp.]